MVELNLNKKKYRTLKQSTFVLLVSVTIMIAIVPFLPSIEYYVEKESNIFSVKPVEASYPVILSTPNYALVGTKEEKEAGLISSVVGLDMLNSENLKQKPIADPEHKQLIIPKIGVDMPIIVTGKEYNEADAYDALNRGAWLYTTTSTPEEGGNTVLAGHRFKYIPPASNTLYSLDKIEKGDEILIYWQGREYTYRVNNHTIVPPSDLTVLNPTPTPTLTLITCTPIFSTANRLIVTASLIGVK